MSNHLRRVGYTSEPERFMQSADLFAFLAIEKGLALPL